MMDYWEECIREAFEDAEITATEEQIQTVIAWVEGAFDNYSLATGRDCIPNPIKLENQSLKRELEKERAKVVCDNCNGKGYIVTYGGTFQSESDCWKCKGEGMNNE